MTDDSVIGLTTDKTHPDHEIVSEIFPIEKGPGTFSFPTHCNKCNNPARLKWAFPKSHAHCERCALPWVLTPRRIFYTAEMLSSPHIIPYTSEGGMSPDEAICWSNTISAFRWASLRQYPGDPARIIVCCLDRIVTILPRMTAIALRYSALVTLHRRFPSCTLTEADVAHGVVHMIISHGGPPQVPLRNAEHSFLQWDDPDETATYRPASLPVPGESICSPFDRHASAYESVLPFGSPIRAEGYEDIFPEHPDAPRVINGIRYGLSYCARASRPGPGRPARDTFSELGKPHDDPLYEEKLRACVAKEFTLGALQWLPEGDFDAHEAPFFGVPKNDTTFRGISDLSFGEDSLNSTVSRSAIPRARLPTILSIITRIIYLHQKYPGKRVFLARMDMVAAFRQLAMMLRLFREAAHRIGGRLAVNVRMPMGAVVSGDQMGPFLTILSDYIAREHDVFAPSYVDDQMIVFVEGVDDGIMEIIDSLWKRCNLPKNLVKAVIDENPEEIKVFLGLEINTAEGTVRIDDDRLQKLNALIDEILFTRQEVPAPYYRKLAGKLNFVSPIIPYGKVFTRSLNKQAWPPDRLAVRKSKPSMMTKLDLTTWKGLLRDFNGSASFYPETTPRVIHALSDASGFGGGAVCHDRKEFMSDTWTRDERYRSPTAIWEAAWVFLASCKWGPLVPGGTLHILSDSTVCVDSFTILKPRDIRIYAILRTMAMMQLRGRYRVQVSHIPGTRNVDADFASRTNRPRPGSMDGYRRVFPTTPQRQIGSIMLWRSRWVRNPDPKRVKQLFASLSNIWITLDIACPHPLRWTPWNNVPACMGASCTLLDGCESTDHTSLETAQQSTLA